MTPQEYKDLATANGYKIDGKTDAELLADYAFHKAACVGMEEELQTTFKDEARGIGYADFHFPYRLRFMRVLDGLDAGRSEAELWAEVCRDGRKKSECFDAGGNLKLSRL